MSEHEEQTYLFELLNLIHEPMLDWIFAIPNGGLRNVVVATKMKAEGVKAGVWDIFVPFPTVWHHGLFIEMKWGSNKLTKTQKTFKDHIREHGYATAICYNGEEAFNVIMEYAGLPQRIIDGSLE